MPRHSAGILLYRHAASGLQVLLVHPGGPYWKNRDRHAWSIPKGEFTDEDPETAARREFREEIGFDPPERLEGLEPIRQSSSKRVYAFAGKGDIDPSALSSNHFEIEWPPRSGKTASFPEVDRAAWFTLEEAVKKLVKGQRVLLDRLVRLI